MKNNPFAAAARSLASDGLDVLLGAVRDTIKDRAGLPSTPRLTALGGFVPAVAEFAEATGHPARWNGDGSVAVLTITHEGRSWQAIACDRGPVVELLVPTDFRFPPGRVPNDLAVYLLTRKVTFGGWVLVATEDGLALYCRATLPADVVTGDLLQAVVARLVAEVAELHDRLDL